jgi:hypothetical protein
VVNGVLVCYFGFSIVVNGVLLLVEVVGWVWLFVFAFHFGLKARFTVTHPYLPFMGLGYAGCLGGVFLIMQT